MSEKLNFLSDALNGVPRAQIQMFLETAERKGTSLVFGGSPVRGNHGEASDIDIGFGNLTLNQSDKTLKEFVKKSGNIDGAVPVEKNIK